MYLNIKPYQIERLIEKPLSCYDDILYTLAKWKNRDCHYMFLDRWTFKKENKKSEIVGDLFLSEYNINESNLLTFHGIKILEKRAETYLELLYAFQKELLKSNPVVVIFDAYECPWDQLFGKDHNKHRCIVVGIDFEKKIIFMCDPYNNKEKEEVSFEQYEKGYMKNYFIVNFIDNVNLSMSNVDNLDLILNSLKNNSNMVSDIHDYAEFFRTHFNPPNELLGYENCFVTPLYINMNILVWNRWTYALLIRYIKKNNELLEKIYKDIKKIALMWNTIKLMMAKSFYIENYRDYIDKIVEKMHHIAFAEESVYKQLQEICEKRADTTIKIVPHISKEVTEIIPISIKEYFNNKGLCYSNKQKIADFTGGKEYLVFEPNELEKNNIYVGEGVEFDNVTCLGQTILLNSLYVKHMIITACSEWGDYEDLIIVNSQNGREKINISISDMSHEPRFGEEILVSGKAYVYRENVINISQELINIFQIKCKICNEVKSFELPLCPNMHIFSINIEI